MRYLKLFESQNIEEICDQYNIKNYHINPDGSIDVDGGVYLYDKRLDKIPLNFGNVSGYFSCRNNSLRDLVGSPKRVGGNFDCSYNELTSLEGCPTYIGGTFLCMNNFNLWSMDYFPRHFFIEQYYFPKGVYIAQTPISVVYNLFRTVYEEDGGKFFSTSGTMMDYFWDCDPVYPNKIIKKRRMNNFLASIGKELKPYNIEELKNGGWKIED